MGRFTTEFYCSEWLLTRHLLRVATCEMVQQSPAKCKNIRLWLFIKCAADWKCFKLLALPRNISFTMPEKIIIFLKHFSLGGIERFRVSEFLFDTPLKGLWSTLTGPLTTSGKLNISAINFKCMSFKGLFYVKKERHEHLKKPAQ